MQSIGSMTMGGKRALLRVDFNVPLGDDGRILDDSRIRASLPTLQHVVEHGASCVVMTHLGRPDGERVESLSLAPVAERLAELMPNQDVRLCDQVIGDRARSMAQNLEPGQILLLENLRFHPGEEHGDAPFSTALAALGDLYINDAFAVCHRNHASVYVVPRKFAAEHRAPGLLLERELAGLAHLVNSPERPFIAVFGGAKVADKLGAISALVGRADEILIGGLTAFPFLVASGHNVGGSPVDGSLLDVAREVLHRGGRKLVLPRDHVIAHKTGIQPDQVSDEIPKHWLGLDIGPVTRAQFAEKIRSARTVIWNGPMGHIEHDVFLEGTRSIAEAMANSAAQIIVGGGETGAIVRRLGFDAQFAHISTGGGAFLAYVAHGTLPALEVLRRD